MNKSSFSKLGNQVVRNVINNIEINRELSDFIKNKDLQNYPHVEKWIKSVVRNYLMQKHDVITVNKEELSEEIQALIEQKNIKPPYHKVEISAEFKDKLSHSIDYLMSSFSQDKDLSRISYEQAQENADVWLENRLKNLSTEEDDKNVITVKSFIKEGKPYRWVNIRSHKGLQRESKLMNHCIETYWEKVYPLKPSTDEVTPYYSLRDENNNPIITLACSGNAYSLEDTRKIYNNPEFNFLVQEIKEKNNGYITNKHRELVDILLEDKCVAFDGQEQILSHYYKCYSDKKEIKSMLSINKIIAEKLQFVTSRLLDVNDFTDIFSKEDLYSIGNWKELVVDGKENFTKLQAASLTVSHIENKIFSAVTDNLSLINATNTTISLENGSLLNKVSYKPTEKKVQNIRYLENCQNVTVNVPQDENSNTWYILKNCENIKISNRTYVTDNPKKLNIIKINSNDVQIDSLLHKNILEINNENDYRYVVVSSKKEKLLGDQDNFACSDISSRNYFLENALNTYIEVSSKLSEKSNTQLHNNFLKQLGVQAKTYIEDTEYSINNKILNEPIGKLLSDVLIDTKNYLSNLYNSHDRLYYNNYSNFLHDNAYYMLTDSVVNNFPSAQEYIKADSNKIENNLLENRGKLVEILNGKVDNFYEYFKSLIFMQNDKAKEQRITIKNNFLFLYMLKNELVSQAISEYKEGQVTNSRFSFAEKRLRKSVCQQWADYLFSDFDASKNEIIKVLMQPLDDNALLKKLEANPVIDKIVNMRLNSENKQNENRPTT